MQLNIWTYNINSIRNKMDAINQLLDKHNIDILFVTETKIMQKHEPDVEKLLNSKYCVIWNSNKNKYHHGTAFIYSKVLDISVIQNYLPNIPTTRLNILNTKHKKILSETPFEKIREDIEKAHKTEGRILTIKCKLNNDQICLVGTYVPNSGSDRKMPLKRLAYRTKYWDIDLSLFLANLQREYEKVIWLGDLNVALRDNDMSISALKRSGFAGVTPEERNNLQKFLGNNWIDSWDFLNKNIQGVSDRCTYGVDSNCPLRLDYVIISRELMPHLISSTVDQEIRASDHVPMGSTFKF